MFTFPLTLFSKNPWTPSDITTELWLDASDTGTITIGTRTDGWVSAEMLETNTYRMFGLNYGPNAGSGFGEINYAIYPNISGDILVYESGFNKGVKSSYTAGDIFEVRKTGTVVTYLKNDAVFYTSTVAATVDADMYVDISLHTVNSTLIDVKTINGDVVWTDVVNATVTNGNNIKRISGSGWGGSGAYSTNTATTTISVSQWDDKSGNGNNATQSNAERPTTGTVTIGGLNTIDFNGSNEFMNLTGLTFDGDHTMIMVGFSTGNGLRAFLRTNPTSAEVLYYGLGNGNVNFQTSYGNGTTWDDVATNTPNIAVNTASIMGVVARQSTTATATPYVNGTAQDDKVCSMPSHTNFFLGSSGTSQYWNGPIAELIIIDSVVSDDIRQKLEGFLAWKWSLVNDLPIGHPYKSNPPTV